MCVVCMVGGLPTQSEGCVTDIVHTSCSKQYHVILLNVTDLHY
jgi:hypothetical protein